MKLQTLILSNKVPVRLVRHILFWVVYAVIFNWQNDARTFLYSASFLPCIILSVYIFIYVLFPNFLQRKKYGQFVVGFLVAYLIVLGLAYCGSVLFFSSWDEPITSRMLFGLALHNQTIAMCLGGITLSIKATKTWYVTQKENMALEKQRVRNELKLEKANLYPEFILQALNSLQAKIQSGAAESPILLLKLSDTLSYILYDSQDEYIELDKELIMVQNIIAFKKLHCDGKFAIHLSVGGDSQNKHITPLTLFRLIQNLFQLIGNNEEGLSEVSIKTQIENDSLFFQLAAIYSCDPSDLENWQEAVAKTRTQLIGLYHSACEFKVAEDECMYSISLGLGLTHVNSIQKKSISPKHNEHVLSQSSTL